MRTKDHPSAKRVLLSIPESPDRFVRCSTPQKDLPGLQASFYDISSIVLDIKDPNLAKKRKVWEPVVVDLTDEITGMQ